MLADKDILLFSGRLKEEDQRHCPFSWTQTSEEKQSTSMKNHLGHSWDTETWVKVQQQLCYVYVY